MRSPLPRNSHPGGVPAWGPQRPLQREDMAEGWRGGWAPEISRWQELQVRAMLVKVPRRHGAVPKAPWTLAWTHISGLSVQYACQPSNLPRQSSPHPLGWEGAKTLKPGP